ncbi:hypothetical protein PHET_05794 [Paragonimus heterotremus]|uniref:Uncharacterized protein n=1 Tax=Paragonimus heterotremus TaxID=100268 RepID=A0A8J4SKP3_9TREM|nr:hypothetical protein PHET_05794 [Paragonimus heterotremus]
MKCCGAIPAAAFHGARFTCLMASSGGPMTADCHRSARRMCDSPDGLFGASRRDPVCSNSVAPPPPPPSCESVEPHPNDRWLSLVRLQSFVGSWDMDAQLANALGIPLSLLETSQPKTWPSPATTTSLQRPVWATALVISYFEHRLTDRKDEWELLAQKARSWLLAQACSVQPDKAVAKQLCDRLLELAKKAIESNIV